MFRVLSVLFILLAASVLLSACAPVAEALKEPPPCRRVTPPAVSKVDHATSQRIPVTNQRIYALFGNIHNKVYAGSGDSAEVLDSSAANCNLYIIVPNQQGVAEGNGRVHVAQVYLDGNGQYLALWNRSGWVDRRLLYEWR